MAKTLQICGNSSYGGAGYLLLKWCEYLISRGWKVDVLATDAFFVRELRRIRGLEVIDGIYIPRNIVPVKDIHAFCQLLCLLRREQYAVVHTYTATPSFLGRVAARLVGVPVIVHHQAGWTVSEFSTRLQRLLLTPLEYIAVMASSKSICVSHAVAAQGRKLHIAPRNKLVTICNGIEPDSLIVATRDDRRREKRGELGIQAGTVVIGNTGRLAAQKDNDTLIQAMVALRAMLADIPFVLLIAGDGPDRKQLEDLVCSLGLEGTVRLVGFCKDIPAFLAALDIFASPSLWEGLSISLLEAMAAAKPIVASSIMPNAELIENEITGLLVPPKSPGRIAQAIARIVREPKLGQRLGQAARQRVLKDFTIDRMFRETLDLYERCLGSVFLDYRSK